MTAPLISAYFAAFNARDFEGMLALLADDVAHDINQGQRELGLSRFRAFLAHMDRCYREQIVDLVVLSDVTGSRFAAEFTVIGSYLETDPGFPEARGQSYRLRAGSFFEQARGKITRVTTYYNVKEWLLQIGATP